MINIDGLDRLKAQLLSSGVQQENFALFQVINQLIQFLRDDITQVNAALAGGGGGGGGGLIGATYLTKEREVGLPNSRQVIAGSGIEFNDSPGFRRTIQTALPFVPEEEKNEDSFTIPLPGPQGFRGFTGLQGIPGFDGFDGEPGLVGPQGPRGIVGPQGIPGLDGAPGEECESLIPGPQGPVGPAGTSSGRIFYLDPSNASDIAGYFTALPAPSANPETTQNTVCAGVGDNLIFSFATDPSIPNVTSIPPGIAFRHIHAAIPTVGGFARFKVESYYCNSDGTGETLIDSAYSLPFTGTAIQEVVWDLYRTVATAILTTQRLVFKLYAARTSGPANVTVTTYYDGAVNPSYLQSTISQGTTGDKGEQGYQGPMGWPGQDGVDGETYPIEGTFKFPPIGEWIAIPFAAGDFTASGAMTWTVAAGDIVNFAYFVIGKTMFIAADIKTTTVGGVADFYLKILIPGGHIAKGEVVGFCRAQDNAVETVALPFTQAGDANIYIQRQDAAVWAAAVNTTLVQFSMFFELQ